MSPIATRHRKFLVMKERSHPPRQPYDHYHEQHIANAQMQISLSSHYTDVVVKILDILTKAKP